MVHVVYCSGDVIITDGIYFLIGSVRHWRASMGVAL